MTSMRFNQDPAAKYGTCETCGEDQPTETASRQHMRETFEASQKVGGTSGHRVRITNPTREHRIQMATGSIVGEALDGAMRDLERIVDKGEATVDEIRNSLWMHGDFSEAWDEWFDEDGDAA